MWKTKEEFKLACGKLPVCMNRTRFIFLIGQYNVRDHEICNESYSCNCRDPVTSRQQVNKYPLQISNVLRVKLLLPSRIYSHSKDRHGGNSL